MIIISAILPFTAPYIPTGPIDCLFPGTWYLTEIDEMHRRKYDKFPDSQIPNGGHIEITESSKVTPQV